MTDPSRRPEPEIAPPPPLTCDDLAARVPAYAAGTIAEPVARAIEWHAAHCPTCEPLLDRILARMPMPEVFTPTGPATVERAAADRWRRRILDRAANAGAGGRTSHRAVGSRGTRPRTMAVGMVLAASLLVLIRTRWTPPDPTGRSSTDARADTTWNSNAGASTAPMRTALLLAQAQAAPEFAALDTAARELEQAIAATPDDEALHGFREALQARRRELEGRVSRVTE